MKKMENISLPEAFVEKMSRLLGDGAGNFFESYERERSFGLRVNPLKAGERLPGLLSGLERIPWSREGFYYPEELRPGKHPLHEAGAYYIQEPSAQACAEALDPRPGERILDLCAAPGGKSTHLAGKMEQKGLLVCNEIHPARAKILSQNIERMGIGNAVVTNMEPAGLVPGFREFFDGIAVDAPCSGEGMFRKDKKMVRAWEEHGPEFFSKLQRSIITQAARMLKPGGMMLYSTCTFDPLENEGTIEYLLGEYPEFEIQEIAGYEGFAPGRPEVTKSKDPDFAKTVRIFPHHMKGEGHYLALLKKSEDAICPSSPVAEQKAKKIPAELEEFFRDVKWDLKPWRLDIHGERVYYMPENLPELKGARFLRSGLLLGELKKKRFEPSQALAMNLKMEEYAHTLNLSSDDDRLMRYLKGETIDVEDLIPAKAKGWHLVCTDGFPLGWGKVTNGTLKNKYLPGWRNQSA